MPGARSQTIKVAAEVTRRTPRLAGSASLRLCVEIGRAENAYIMRTKCAQNRKCDFSTRVASTTYNFILTKCTHFPACPPEVSRPVRARPVPGTFQFEICILHFPFFNSALPPPLKPSARFLRLYQRMLRL